VAEWLEVVVAEAKAAMLSARMLKKCIFGRSGSVGRCSVGGVVEAGGWIV
jgi:hypothetical protein